jgi:hypothetical protein
MRRCSSVSGGRVLGHFDLAVSSGSMVLPFHHPNFSPFALSVAKPEFGTAFQPFKAQLLISIQAYYLDVLGRSTANLIDTPTYCLVVPFLATIPDI